MQAFQGIEYGSIGFQNAENAESAENAERHGDGKCQRE
jgi:hypothetical protein